MFFKKPDTLANQAENKNFFRTATAWQGSVTPQVLPRVAVTALYSLAIVWLSKLFPRFSIDITPFEFSGAALGLLLVQRMNSGMDRWWEARKMWGSIVNQSRNLAIVASTYRGKKDALTQKLLIWVAAWPHVMRGSLRNEPDVPEVTRLLGAEEAAKVQRAVHPPSYVAVQIAETLFAMRKDGLDDFAFHRAESERGMLIDAIGACERIRNTPIPLVLAIKTRRFILLFLLLLPLALIERLDYLTPLVVVLASYPLFSLDEIGAELQNPFSPRNLSHLPLLAICNKIEKDVLDLAK
ncbi:hypothetical protein K2X33_16150 [bacterium]|nr:hypothetical protein [bacterium]